jgi:hypothetical protein
MRLAFDSAAQSSATRALPIPSSRATATDERTEDHQEPERQRRRARAGRSGRAAGQSAARDRTGRVGGVRLGVGCRIGRDVGRRIDADVGGCVLAAAVGRVASIRGVAVVGRVTSVFGLFFFGADIADAVFVRVELVGVCVIGAVVADVAESVFVGIGLIRVGNADAVVVGIGNAIAVFVDELTDRCAFDQLALPAIFDLTHVAAAVGSVGVAIVAPFVSTQATVAADDAFLADAGFFGARPAVLDRADVVATVAELQVQVVAGLVAGDDAVAAGGFTHRRRVFRVLAGGRFADSAFFDAADGAAAVGVIGVAVIAGFGANEQAIAADREAGALHGVDVFAGPAFFDHARRRAAIAVAVVAVITGLVADDHGVAADSVARLGSDVADVAFFDDTQVRAAVVGVGVRVVAGFGSAEQTVTADRGAIFTGFVAHVAAFDDAAGVARFQIAIITYFAANQSVVAADEVVGSADGLADEAGFNQAKAGAAIIFIVTGLLV